LINGFQFWDIHSLVDAGLCKQPSDIHYTLAFIDSGFKINRSTKTNAVTELADFLQPMPDIMEELIWHFFVVEGGGDISLSAVDKYSGKGIWSATLIELSERGVLSRERLLDSSLDALGRGFAQFRANWFSRFHTALCPTFDERKARSEQYLQLLASNSTTTVSFAIKSLTQLDAKHGVDAKGIITYIRPAMQAKAKSTIKAALQLLENAMHRAPEHVLDALPIVIESLIHESADVQKKALLVLNVHKMHLNDEMRSELVAYADAIVPSLRNEFDALIGEALESTEEVDVVHKGLDTVPLNPVSDFSSCLRLYLAVLESTANPTEIELLLDGLCRLSNARTADDTVVLANHSGEYDEIRTGLARLAIGLVEYWTTVDQTSQDDATVNPSFEREERSIDSLDDLFHFRNEWVFTIIKENKNIPLLSTPTDNRCYISGTVLLNRFAQYTERKVSPDEFDLVIAMMRLDPVDRDNVYPTLLKNKFAKSIRKDIELNLRSDYGTFQCVEPANGLLKTEYQNNPVDLFGIVNEYNQLYSYLSGPLNANRWYATVWPTNSEAFYAHALNGFDSVQILSNSPYQAYFEPMLREDFSPGQCGVVLLLAGLVGHDPSIKTLAIDAFIPAAYRGALDINTMGKAASELFPVSRPLSRYTDVLKEIVDIAPTLSLVVLDLIAETLRYEPNSPPRGLAGLIDLLFELCLLEDVAMEHSDALSFLGQLKPTSSAGKSAKKVLSLTRKCA